MEEAKVKKEIVVKRLSAFKFAVEVNSKTESPPRVSVIQRAPPASPQSPQQSAKDTVVIRHAIMQRIVEMLLWKLLGEQRLRTFCGYPSASPSSLLWRVVQYSSSQTTKNTLQNHTCTEGNQCFIDHVSQFLKICAPTEELWVRFGWSKLSEEAILRKIYEEELSPSFGTEELQKDTNMLYVCADMQYLLQWERQGYTAITWTGNKYFSALLPPSRESNKITIQPSGIRYMKKESHESTLDKRRKVDERREYGERCTSSGLLPTEPWTNNYRLHRMPFSRINEVSTSLPSYIPYEKGIRRRYKPYEHSIKELLSKK